MKEYFSNFLQKIQVSANDQEKTSNWVNRDIMPLPSRRCTWNDWDFVGFWAVIALSISTWQGCSSLLSIGLNVWQSMVIIIIAKLLMFLIAVAHGWGGAVWHIGFPIYCRFTFGIIGSFFAFAQRIILCIVWYAEQAYTGGMCLSILLGSIFPSFYRMKNHFPESLPMTTKTFIGFVLYHVLSIPFLYIPPEKFKAPFRYVSLISLAAILGTSIGSMVHAHGAGNLLTSKSSITGSSNMGMTWMYGINIVINSYAVGLANQPDFSRFVKRPGQQIYGQAFSILVLGTIIPFLGLLGTSAASKSYGDVSTLGLWNPPNIISLWLEEKYDSKSRAAAFFASFGFFISTLGLNTIDNGVSGAMDLTALVPKFINIRRGVYIIMIISIVINPWQIVSKATIFTNVLGSYGCFLGPMIGVMISDYFLIRKQKLKISDLYISEKGSIYWFFHGFNLRSWASWVAGFIPGIIGFPSVNPALTGKVPEAAIKLFHISFIIGFIISFLLQTLLGHIFPPAGLGELDDVNTSFSGEELNQISTIQDINSTKSDELGSSGKSEAGIRELSVTKA